MRNPIVRSLCRLVALAMGVLAFHRYAWMPEHADHVLKTVNAHTSMALQWSGDRAIFAARDNIDRLQEIAPACRLSVAFHLVYAANDRILGRSADAIEHYSAALAAAQRPEIYFDRGATYLEAGKLDAATPDLALATRFNPYLLDEVDGVMRDRIAAFNKSLPYNPPPR